LFVLPDVSHPAVPRRCCVFDSTWTEATFWVAAVACAVAQAAIVRSVFVARVPAAGPGGDVPRPAPARRAPEVAWAVLPALALAGVLALTWRAMHPAPNTPPAAPAAAAAAPTAAPGAAEV
jgi:heme/copper-type cytochrome/quinol oxidase subunit 2